MRAVLLAVPALFLPLLAGCASADGLALGEPLPPRPLDWPVDVFVDPGAPVALQKAVGRRRAPAAVPPGARRIGRVDARGGDDASWDVVWEAALERTRELGGDAVVVRRWSWHPDARDGDGDRDCEKLLALDVLRYAAGRPGVLGRAEEPGPRRGGRVRRARPPS